MGDLKAIMAGAWVSRLKYVWFGTHGAHGPAATQPPRESDVRAHYGAFFFLMLGCFCFDWLWIRFVSEALLSVLSRLSGGTALARPHKQTRQPCGHIQCDFSKKAGAESTCKVELFLFRSVRSVTVAETHLYDCFYGWLKEHLLPVYVFVCLSAWCFGTFKNWFLTLISNWSLRWEKEGICWGEKILSRPEKMQMNI